MARSPPLFATLLVPIIAADLSPRLLPIVLAGLITIEISVLLRRQICLAILSAVTWLLYVIFSPILAMDFLDSGVSFFLILTILFSNEHYHTNSKKYIYAAAIASALCAATKIFGLAAGLYLLFFILYLRLNKSGKIMTNERLISKILPIFVALVGSSVWFLYGFLVQSQLFLALLTANANRSILSAHNLNFLVFISTPIISASQISIGTLSPLLVIGWFGILYMFTVPKFRVLQIGLSSYLGFVIILGYAWFYTLIPFYPFFCIGIGSLCLDAISLVENGHRNARDI